MHAPKSRPALRLAMPDGLKYFARVAAWGAAFMAEEPAGPQVAWLLDMIGITAPLNGS